ncbi:hypothetical protein DPEC_G00268240 [Dallia pectoralis]|uniref:Uncharacterized protein n=1 Tax=Dallia pectoralis TaxID=75939 RepID=A0ACC2FP08_DALPE|nr:hypothetical protein DPEC_G00268240 [Dallia pectoralis]
MSSVADQRMTPPRADEPLQSGGTTAKHRVGDIDSKVQAGCRALALRHGPSPAPLRLSDWSAERKITGPGSTRFKVKSQRISQDNRKCYGEGAGTGGIHEEQDPEWG